LEAGVFTRSAIPFWIRGAVVALVLPSAAGAQSTTPAPLPHIRQDVFVTATLSEATGPPPRTTAVLTRDDLSRMGLTSVVDALRLIPGLDPRARGPRDVQTDLSVRGATFGQNLVLVDGFRLNNTQSGHHNGEIPVPVAAVDRIEVVYGAGSAVHGADALGGTINVITRRGAFRTASASFGQHGYAAAEAAFSGRGLPDGWMVAGWGSRSRGFMFDRDFAQGGALVRGDVGPAWTVDVRHQRRAFGANGFYGASPSKEWTDQTLAGATWRRAGASWVGSVRGHVRNHHDHFRWDINRPGFAENRHRTDAVEATATLTRDWSGGRRTTVGLTGGTDRVTSSNLGDHTYHRGGIFAELIVPVAERATTQFGIRFDEYSTFGSSVSPSAGASVFVSPALRLHASASRAFRVPTFTELYYSDPANLGSPDLRAEHGWSLDAGADWIRGGWLLSVTPFWRRDENVIDWTRPTIDDRWRSTNVRDVTTRGVETAVTRRWGQGLVRAYYSLIDIDAPALDVLSKYVLEYARHQGGGSISTPIGAGFRVAMNLDHRHRLDGQSYQLVSARLSRQLADVDLFVDGTNLLNENYREIAGVPMPGRWVTVGIGLR
jgi:iron complex outermembrane receptor protein